MRPEEFWRPSLHQKSNPVLSTEALALAEERLGVRLPPEYVELLKVQNGGYTAGFAFPMAMPTSWAEDHVPCDSLAGIVIDEPHASLHNMLQSPAMIEEWTLPQDQVLLDGDGHWWISLDYRTSREPVVTWLDVEAGQDLLIAPSFRDFLAGLVPASQFAVDSHKLETELVGWKPDRIQYALEEPGAGSTHQVLRLRQELEQGESGWAMMKLSMPANWQIAALRFRGEDLTLQLADKRQYRINDNNRGKLLAAIVGCQDPSALEEAWLLHASLNS